MPIDVDVGGGLPFRAPAAIASRVGMGLRFVLAGVSLGGTGGARSGGFGSRAVWVAEMAPRRWEGGTTPEASAEAKAGVDGSGWIMDERLDSGAKGKGKEGRRRAGWE